MKRKYFFGISQSGTMALATMLASSASAHPGINEHSDVLAAAHDLGHAAQAYPSVVAVAAVLVLAAGIILTLKLIRNSTQPANLNGLKSTGGQTGR